MAFDKRFVDVLRNADQDPLYYVGLTSNVNARLTDHNAGRCKHTASGRQWQLHVVIEFTDEDRANSPSSLVFVTFTARQPGRQW